jgi:predicted nucleotidyltransferase
MIEAHIKDDILARLKRVEETEHVRILMAIESGSRAWGFASPNSDYDVRFIYVRDRDWYLSVDLEDRRDVIEYPIVDEIDLNGWDVRKALKLFWKSNPALVEWIQSPITYIENGSFRKDVYDLLPEIYSIKKGIYHYRSMAKTNYRGYLKQDTVPLKKYFYVLRPLLAVRWFERFNSPAPIEFKELLTLIEDPDLLELINGLLDQKMKSTEKELIPLIPELNQFIEAELTRLDEMILPQTDNERDYREINCIFRNLF